MRASEFIPEHKMVWKRSPKGNVSLKWRCTSGPRAGRSVPNVADCGKPLDFAQAQRMKKTRAQTKVRQARKAKKTKRVNPKSKLLRMLNRYMKEMENKG